MIRRFNVLSIKISARIFEDTDKIFYNLYGKVKVKHLERRVKEESLYLTLWVTVWLQESQFRGSGRRIDTQTNK